MARICCFFFFFLWIGYLTSTYAADWLTLIGTEPPDSNYKIWGIVQPQYVYDYGDSIEGLTGPSSQNNGKRVVKNSPAPWFDEREEFSIRRLRAGVRGRFSTLWKNSFTDRINYFLMVEAGQNLMTYSFLGERDRPFALSDLFITFNHIPGLKIQTGLFKNPGPEEVFQPAGFCGDYIDFTDFVGREFLERFSKGSVRMRPVSEGGEKQIIGDPQTTAYGFSAARDWGVQFFDNIKTRGKWNFAYALKFGRGESISTVDTSNATPEVYLYSSAEYRLPGGKGPDANGLKFYTWFQWGKRTFVTDPDERAFDRYRYGTGLKALGNLLGIKQRFAFELLFADGMIFLSPTGNVKGGYLQYALDQGNRTRGITLDYGIYVSKLQLNFRWHWHDILYATDGIVWTEADHRRITETTFGLRYNFTQNFRVMCDFTLREAIAPESKNSNIINVVDTIGNRVALQLTWIL